MLLHKIDVTSFLYLRNVTAEMPNWRQTLKVQRRMMDLADPRYSLAVILISLVIYEL
jgi:hypothetical protein